MWAHDAWCKHEQESPILIWVECARREEDVATNPGGEENESDSTNGGDNELASNAKSNGSKFWKRWEPLVTRS